MAKLPPSPRIRTSSIGQRSCTPDNSLDRSRTARMMFAVPSEPYESRPRSCTPLKQILILHADHEQNCSTSTVRMVGSAEANLYASIAAGVDALWVRCTAARIKRSWKCSRTSATTGAT